MKYLLFVSYLIISLFSVRALGERHQPTIAPHTLYKPTFVFADGNTRGVGTCFAVSWTNYRFIVTAHHLFGLAGGLDSQLTPGQIESAVLFAQLNDIYSGEISNSGRYLKFGDAMPTSLTNGATKDIAVFQGGSGSDGLPIASKEPLRGDFVWLLAQSKDENEHALLHAAEVIFINEKFVLYRFENSGLNLRATSGAPIVNEAGEIVAVNTAAIVIPYILKIGIGGPINYLTEQLKALVNARSDVEI